MTDWHIPMGVVMRRETFYGGGKRPRCSVRPPTYEGRHVASGPDYGTCDAIGHWKRGEQHLCDFHAGIAATLDWLDRSVSPAWPLLGWQSDLPSLAKWLADYQHFMQWRTRTLHSQLPGINLDGLWKRAQEKAA